jgi:hypothetical protein
MRRFGTAQLNLFGEETHDNISIGEHYLIKQYLWSQDDFLGRADWAFENIPYTGTLMLELEDHLLLEGALKEFIFGLYASVIITADAFCERLLTDAIETHEHTKAARSGLWKIIKVARRLNLLHEYLLKRIERLHQIRNSFCHQKELDHGMKLDRRQLSDNRHYLDILKTDAKEALCLMYGLAGRLPRYFPRFAIPGVGIVEELRRENPKRRNKAFK